MEQTRFETPKADSKNTSAQWSENESKRNKDNDNENNNIRIDMDKLTPNTPSAMEKLPLGLYNDFDSGKRT